MTVGPVGPEREIISMFSLLGTIIMGALVGWIAGKLMDVEHSLVWNIIVGIAGSAVGSALFRLVGFYAFGWIANLIVSVIGACVFIWVGRKPFH